jgi:hypothetical protein
MSILYSKKNMKKNILISMIVCIASIGSVFANDCSILLDEGKTTPTNPDKTVIDENIEARVSSYNDGYGKEYKNILSTTGFKKALDNLKSFCCTKIIRKSCDKDMKNIKQPYPESAYLFDHLVDVSMRRLDGITGLAYNISPDPTAMERRKKITEIASSPNGRTAKEIESLYTGYRTINSKNTKDIIKKDYTDTKVVTLGDKYNNICTFMKEIYESTSNTAKTPIGNAFFNGCRGLVKDRVKRETSYIKILMVEKSNQLFTEATKAYTKKHFVEEKLMALWNLVSKVKDVFQTIVQQAPASKKCSK